MNSNDFRVVASNELNVRQVAGAMIAVPFVMCSAFVVAFAVSYVNEIVATLIFFQAFVACVFAFVLCAASLIKNAMMKNRRRVARRLVAFVDAVNSTFIDEAVNS